LETRIQDLETTVAERDAKIDALQARLDARGSAEARLNERLEALRSRLPAPEGGSLTAAEARKQAQTDAERLAALIRQGRGLNNPQLWRQVREAENALHHSQFLLARSDNARTVYRVRPGDTLPQVSLMFYGDEDHWARLFDANRHLVDDPNRLLPGLTLVVP
jgi:nucleoid-associated protein YgaU